MKQKCSNTFETPFDVTSLAFINTELTISNHVGAISLLLSTSNRVILYNVDRNSRNVKMLKITEGKERRSEAEIK